MIGRAFHKQMDYTRNDHQPCRSHDASLPQFHAWPLNPKMVSIVTKRYVDYETVVFQACLEFLVSNDPPASVYK